MSHVAEPTNVRLDRPEEPAPFLLEISAWQTALAAAREAGWIPEQPEHLYAGDLRFEFSGTDAAACASALERVLDAPADPSALDRLMLSVAAPEWQALIAFLRRGQFHVRSC